MMDGFFTNAFDQMQDKEEFYKTVFMNMYSEIINPQYISLGDDVFIGDGVTIHRQRLLSRYECYCSVFRRYRRWFSRRLVGCCC